MSLLMLALAAQLAPGALALPARWSEALHRGEVHVRGSGAVGEPGTPIAGLGYAIVLAEGNESLVLEAADQATCRGIIAEVTSALPRREIVTRGHRLVIEGGLLRGETGVLYDLADVLCPARWEDLHDQVSIQAEVVSAVGPWVTLSEKRSEALAGGPPYHGETWTTLDASTGDVVDLVDLVDEASLLDALRRDPYVARRFAARLPELAAAATFARARAIMLDDASHHGMVAFGFTGYDPVGDRVAVRLAFTADECGMCPNEVRTLGLWVTPKPALREAARAAKRGQGLFVSAPPVRIG